MSLISAPIQSMRLFSNSTENENNTPSCVIRSCCLRVVRLEVFRALELELKTVVICVAMQGSRRSLRSDQIPLQPGGMLDVELDLVFTLQYPHFLKRRENRLQIMLQRRKKYKTRTILGYKTFAVGRINMAQVLQGWCPKQLHLYTKNEKYPAATITIANLSSEPIDREISDRHRVSIAEHLNSSDEDGDDDSYSSDIEDSGGEMEGVEDGYRRQSSRRRKQSSRNFKQKIIRALFKRLRVTDEDLGDVHNLQDELQEECLDVHGEFMFDDDEEEDSDNDMLDDNMSIASVQRPSLRPYFDQNKSQITLNQNTLTRDDAKDLLVGLNSIYTTTDSNEEDFNDTDIEKRKGKEDSPESFVDIDWDIGSNYLGEAFEKNAPRSISFRERRQKIPLKRKRSVDLEKIFKESTTAGFSDQLSAVLGTDDTIPEYVLMVGLKDEAGRHLAIKLMARFEPVICTSGSDDVQATIAAIVNKFQKFCNRHAALPPSLRIGVIGPENYLRVVVKSYVNQFSQKSQEYQNYVKFLIIPSGHHRVATYIGQLDNKYQNLFMDSFWKGLFDHGFISETDIREVEKRILQYIDNADSIHSIPIAEALITFKSNDGESSQEFIPFINEVRLGSSDVCSFSDNPEAEVVIPTASISPREPNGSSDHRPSRDYSLLSSPRSDCIEHRNSIVGNGQETLDLIVDYWPVQVASLPQNVKKEDKKEINKLSIKSTFRTLCVSRLPYDNDDYNCLHFSANMKSRNKGVKRLMKQRDKDSEAKSSVSAIVGKIVCTARSTGHTFTAIVDGKEWNNVKFFSLSSQWPTHIKTFPIGMFLNYGYTGS